MHVWRYIAVAAVALFVWEHACATLGAKDTGPAHLVTVLARDMGTVFCALGVAVGRAWIAVHTALNIGEMARSLFRLANACADLALAWLWYFKGIYDASRAYAHPSLVFWSAFLTPAVVLLYLAVSRGWCAALTERLRPCMERARAQWRQTEMEERKRRPQLADDLYTQVAGNGTVDYAGARRSGRMRRARGDG